MNIYITNILVTFFSIFFSFNSYGGFFDKTICFENDAKVIEGVIYLSGENMPFSGKSLCKYSNGKKKSKGFFRDGLKNNIWIEWNENSQVSYQKKYDQNRIIKLIKYQNDELLTTTDYSFYDKENSQLENQKLHNGQKKCITNYDGSDNKVEEVCWYLNGQKWFETSFKDNKFSGMHTYWFEDGEIWSEIFY